MPFDTVFIICFILSAILIGVGLYLLSRKWPESLWILQAQVKPTQGETPLLASGIQGKTITALAPTGIVEIKNSTYEARSQIGFIEKDSSIRVLRVEFHTVIVEKV